MNVSPRTLDRLDPADWIIIGYFCGVLVLAFLQAAEAATTTATETTSTYTWTEDEITLTEEHLQRLEDGETVKIPRWHGHDLVLGGSMVIDAEQIGEEDTEG